jgi:hypothetical protein
VQEYLDEGIPPDQLVEDLSQITALVPEEAEDSVIDDMDLLVGWCTPGSRLVPATRKNFTPQRYRFSKMPGEDHDPSRA